LQGCKKSLCENRHFGCAGAEHKKKLKGFERPDESFYDLREIK